LDLELSISSPFDPNPHLNLVHTAAFTSYRKAPARQAIRMATAVTATMMSRSR
jgi:hypothetical protein